MYLLWAICILGVLPGVLSDVWILSCVYVWVLFVRVLNGGWVCSVCSVCTQMYLY